MMALLPSSLRLLFPAAIACYLAAFGLHNYMVMRANKGLPENDQIPYSLHFKGWNRVAKEYGRFYPRSHIYPLALSCAIATTLLALVIAAIRVWQYAAGK
jgi:hypothetical protein